MIARDMAIYGGLRPWKQGLMLAATTSHKVVQINPWCNSSSCGATSIVDVPKAIGAETVSDHFALGGITLCGDDALFVAYGASRIIFSRISKVAQFYALQVHRASIHTFSFLITASHFMSIFASSA